MFATVKDGLVESCKVLSWTGSWGELGTYIFCKVRFCSGSHGFGKAVQDGRVGTSWDELRFGRLGEFC